MTIKELAEKLNGNEIGKEISIELEEIAYQHGLVVVFGASDDLMELRGFINDEVGCCNGGAAYIETSGLLENKCDDDECPYFEKIKGKAKEIEAIWDTDGYSWIYETTIPHETFVIFEDEKKYCKGIVFDIKDL